MSQSGSVTKRFSLVEVLVTLIVVSILAIVAVPTFLSQSAKKADTATKSDLRNLVSQMESSGGRYLTAQQMHDQGINFHTSSGSVVTVAWANEDGYCLLATNPKADKAQSPVLGISTKVFYFESAAGSMKTPDTSGPGCLDQNGASVSNGYFDSTGFHAGAIKL